MFGDPVRNTKKWPTLKLSQLGNLERGRSKHRPRNDPRLLGGPYPLVQTSEVSSAEIFIKNYTQSYSELGLQQSKLWKAGTLCITIAANIARTAILGFDACFPDSIVGFTSYGKINVVFLHYWFQYLQKMIESQATQVAQKNINLKILSSLDVLVPPENIQNQFADFVHHIDKSRLKTEKSSNMIQHMIQHNVKYQFFR